tara:strand:- start:266 stop:379 length:114 start_codon:yes stop_codon:yes gene_type:complete
MWYFENILALVVLVAFVFFVVWQMMLSIDDMMMLKGF